MMRIQIPAYTDRWMMGDRFGEVLSISKVPLKRGDHRGPIARVKLDISGKTISVLIDDCSLIYPWTL